MQAVICFTHKIAVKKDTSSDMHRMYLELRNCLLTLDGIKRRLCHLPSRYISQQKRVQKICELNLKIKKLAEYLSTACNDLMKIKYKMIGLMFLSYNINMLHINLIRLGIQCIDKSSFNTFHNQLFSIRYHVKEHLIAIIDELLTSKESEAFIKAIAHHNKNYRDNRRLASESEVYTLRSHCLKLNGFVQKINSNIHPANEQIKHTLNATIKYLTEVQQKIPQMQLTDEQESKVSYILGVCLDTHKKI